MEWSRLTAFSDEQLLASLEACASKHQQSEVVLIAHIAEVDRRKLYRQEACSSMHVYCVERLGLSDDMAFKRIRVARAARRYPEILRRRWHDVPLPHPGSAGSGWAQSRQ